MAFLLHTPTTLRTRRLTTVVTALVTDWSRMLVNRTREELDEYNYAIACWREAARTSPLQEAKDCYNNAALELEIERDSGKNIIINVRV